MFAGAGRRTGGAGGPEAPREGGVIPGRDIGRGDDGAPESNPAISSSMGVSLRR
jgi:hypothetical protein